MWVSPRLSIGAGRIRGPPAQSPPVSENHAVTCSSPIGVLPDIAFTSRLHELRSCKLKADSQRRLTRVLLILGDCTPPKKPNGYV